jgi:SAM-dependent methyltransferase
LTVDPLQPYRESIRDHGAGFEATLWGSRQTQRLRFEVMAEMLGAGTLQGTDVLDLGCGDGAFADWLAETGVTARVQGFDAMPEMIQVAQQRSIEGATFDVVDLRDDWPHWAGDWCIVSGTLNTMDDALVATVLDQAWRVAERGLVFNFLGDAPAMHWKDKPLGPSIRRSVSGLHDWAQRMARRVEVRSDYLDGHDVTIAMWR